MKVTTVHNAFAGMVQMYSELLEEQVKENIELRNQLRGYIVESERRKAEEAAKVPHPQELVNP